MTSCIWESVLDYFPNTELAMWILNQGHGPKKKKIIVIYIVGISFSHI